MTRGSDAIVGLGVDLAEIARVRRLLQPTLSGSGDAASPTTSGRTPIGSPTRQHDSRPGSPARKP